MARTLTINSALVLALIALAPIPVAAQIGHDRYRDEANARDYEQYRDSISRPTYPERPRAQRPRVIPEEPPPEAIVPYRRYDERSLDDYWHDRLQQYRWQHWYGDNYNRYWPPNYRGYFRNQDPPYAWWNDGGRRQRDWR